MTREAREHTEIDGGERKSVFRSLVSQKVEWRPRSFCLAWNRAFLSASFYLYPIQLRQKEVGEKDRKLRWCNENLTCHSLRMRRGRMGKVARAGKVTISFFSIAYCWNQAGAIRNSRKWCRQYCLWVLSGRVQCSGCESFFTFFRLSDFR